MKMFIQAYKLWAQKDSNLRPSACKADALNQLSYAPSEIWRLLVGSDPPDVKSGCSEPTELCALSNLFLMRLSSKAGANIEASLI